MKQKTSGSPPSTENPRQPGVGGGKSGKPQPPRAGDAAPAAPPSAEPPAAAAGEAEPGAEEGPEGAEKPTGGAESGGGGAAAPIRSPASLLRPRKVGTQGEEPSPFTVEHLPLLMDRLTTQRSTERRITGLINVNTAPRQVLECLGELDGEKIESILALRETLDAETLSTPAWLVTQGAVDVETFDKIATNLTSRSQQYSIESLGYGDHIGMVTRLQVVVDMVGPIAQTIYYRDLSYLGGSYPIREEDKEQVRGR